MTDLSRNLLAAAREGLSPDAAVAARVRARVAAAVGAPVATATAPANAASVAKASALKAGALKVGVAALLAVGVVVAIVAMPRDDASVPTVGAAASEQEPTSAPRVAGSEHVTAPTAAPAAPAAIAPLPTLAREVELVDQAMLSLRGHDPADALAAIAIYDRETRGRGQLAEDAAAIAIEAHCALEHDVTARLAAFDRAYPTSAQRARLRTACRQ